MDRRSQRLRPRYSLRVLLMCVTVFTVVVALYREPLRERMEQLRERWEQFLAGDSDGLLVDRISIEGPVTTAGTLTAALGPPSPDEIAWALQKAGAINKVPRNSRMVIEPIASYVDPPRVYPLVGPAQLHHAHYRCRIISDDGERTVYVDRNHFRAVNQFSGL
jgi:hypothetical protein